MAELVDCELTDSVGYLLAEKREETGVEAGDTFIGCDFGESGG